MSNISNIKIDNKRKYLTIIFKDFYCTKRNKCTLTSFFYKNRKKGYKINLNIYNNSYLCILNNTVIYMNNNNPVIEKFNCKRKKYNGNIYNKILIGGIPNIINKNLNKINDIPNQFFLSRIIIDKKCKKFTKIIIKGKLFNDLMKNIVDLIIFVVYPKIYLNCQLKKSSKYVQSDTYCVAKKKIDSEILIENQVIYNKDYSESLLLINQITLYQNYEIIDNNYNLNDRTNNNYFIFLYFIKIILLLILLKFKLKNLYI